MPLDNLSISAFGYTTDQGEGSRAGIPCVFIRLAGCHLRCTWCDTEYGYTGGKEMSINEILSMVENYNCQLVEVTGGEPLMQEEAPLVIAAGRRTIYTFRSRLYIILGSVENRGRLLFLFSCSLAATFEVHISGPPFPLRVESISTS